MQKLHEPSQVKFIVSTNPTLTKDSYRGNAANKLGIPIVDIHFLDECIIANSLLELDRDLVLSETEKLQSGRIGKIHNLCFRQNCFGPKQIYGRFLVDK